MGQVALSESPFRRSSPLSPSFLVPSPLSFPARCFLARPFFFFFPREEGSSTGQDKEISLWRRALIFWSLLSAAGVTISSQKMSVIFSPMRWEARLPAITLRPSFFLRLISLPPGCDWFSSRRHVFIV